MPPYFAAPYFGDAPTLGLYPTVYLEFFLPCMGFFFLFTSPRPTLKWKEEKLRNCPQPVNRLRGWEMREIYFSYSSKMKRNNSDKILRTVLHPLCMDGSHLFCARPLVTAAALVADAQSACCLALCVCVFLCVRPSRARPALIFSCDLQFPSSSLLVVLLWLWRSSSGRCA